MNIFVLDQNPKLAAQMHCDRHVVKMILESAQLLSTAHRLLDGVLYQGKSNSGRAAKRWLIDDDRETHVYQATHINHPCAVWVRECDANYKWLYNLFIELNEEYTHRYKKVHKCMTMAPQLQSAPKNIRSSAKISPFPTPMPDDVKTDDPVQSFRNYYIHYKNGFARWTNRETPSWYKVL